MSVCENWKEIKTIIQSRRSVMICTLTKYTESTLLMYRWKEKKKWCRTFVLSAIIYLYTFLTHLFDIRKNKNLVSFSSINLSNHTIKWPSLLNRKQYIYWHKNIGSEYRTKRTMFDRYSSLTCCFFESTKEIK